MSSAAEQFVWMRRYRDSDIWEWPWKNSTSQNGPGSAFGYLKNATFSRSTHQSTGLPLHRDAPREAVADGEAAEVDRPPAGPDHRVGEPRVDE